MKKILLATVALAALAAPAAAADLAARPTYTKAPVAPPVLTWTGFYIGAMGGYASQTDDGIKGGFAGGTIGYNWQQGAVVFGIEADAAWADINRSAAGIATTAAGVPFAVTASAKIQDWGTVRGRIGYAFGPTLLYATGGYAWADTKLGITVPGAFSTSDSQIHSGWVVGAGAEWMFAPQWSLKGEYLYKSFDSKNYTFNALGASVTAASGNFDIHSVQVGVNYHF
ncbi:outer membrane immunogenic protein [Bradyrhizobium sp. USDA 4369]